MLKVNTNARTSSHHFTQYCPKTERFAKFYIYKHLKSYNTMDSVLKSKGISGFKSNLK